MEILNLINAFLIVLTSFGVILSIIMFLLCIVLRDIRDKKNDTTWVTDKKQSKFLDDMTYYRDKTIIKTVILFILTVMLNFII